MVPCGKRCEPTVFPTWSPPSDRLPRSLVVAVQVRNSVAAIIHEVIGQDNCVQAEPRHSPLEGLKSRFELPCIRFLRPFFKDLPVAGRSGQCDAEDRGLTRGAATVMILGRVSPWRGRRTVETTLDAPKATFSRAPPRTGNWVSAGGSFERNYR